MKRSVFCGLLISVIVSLLVAGSPLSAIGASIVSKDAALVYGTLADYESETGQKISSFKESPELAKLVAEGTLPAVEERISEEPLVVVPKDAIGKYGGVLRTGTIGPEINGFPAESLRWESLIQVAADLKTLQPSIVKDWKFSSDKSVLTLYLRKGMKWSDGEPFTADDFMFWYNDMILNDELTPVKPKEWSPYGELVVVEKKNEYEVSFAFAGPYPAVLSILAAKEGYHPYAPAHYMKKFHKAYNENSEAEAKTGGFDSWVAAFKYHNEYDADWQDVERPSVQAWILGEIDSYGNKHYVRNPYFWKIDVEGNQLPYIDGITKLLYDNREVLDLKIVAGDIDIASRNLPVGNYTLYKKGEADGDYRVILGDGVRGAACAVLLNQTVKDPLKREFFQNEKFKQAMSVAINRQEMNDLLFFGRAVPRQQTMLPSCSFYEDWMGEYFAQFDTDLANKLLDEIGLDKKDSGGFRLGPDGKVLTILIETGPWEVYPKIAEMIAGYWSNVGIKSTAKTLSAALVGEKNRANESEAQLQGYAQVSEFIVFGNTIRFRPPWIRSAYPWWNWWASGGKEGEEPPEEVKRILQVVEDWQKTEPGTDEYLRLGKEMLTLNVKGLYVIGTVGLEPMPVVVKNFVKNVPEKGTIAWDYYFWKPFQASQFYIDK